MAVGAIWGLAPYPEVSLAKAREKSVGGKAASRRGYGPSESQNRDRSYLCRGRTHTYCKQSGWWNAKHVAQWSSTLETYAFPVLGNMDVNGIDARDVLNVLNPIWSAKPETANVVRQRKGSRLSSITQRPSASAKDLTSLVGAAICKTYWPSRRRFARSSIMLHWIGARCPSS